MSEITINNFDNCSMDKLMETAMKDKASTTNAMIIALKLINADLSSASHDTNRLEKHLKKLPSYIEQIKKAHE
ncbi:hypothetical protein [Aliivibrio sp. S10_S31]|uniref:hypothetical protein n=1 Tax=Aliivibrio sp. S10_S31 TaxID=2720224 RepID=UPI001680BC02|nr:hypothetical protein [Aliivibrio sp. S10_S31]MBD1567933.1 hypothetical protein [Aliivibrio sp. S10_S31]